MIISTIITAGTLLSPFDVATPANMNDSAPANPTVQVSTGKDLEESVRTGMSIMGTQSYVGPNWCIDDSNSWD